MSFQSEFRSNPKLLNCAVNDSDRISEYFSSKGPWVLLIKKALNAWAGRQPFPVRSLPMTDIFDKETGDLVALYKNKQNPPLKNIQGQIDRIVGKKTVLALDKELPPVNERIKPSNSPVVDFIIKLTGTLGTAPQPLHHLSVFKLDSTDFENSGELLAKYKSKPNRFIARIGSQTVTIGTASVSLIKLFISHIERVLDQKSIGKFFIFGSSSGGRNAIDLAVELTKLKGDIEYLAVMDPAFFPQDAQNQPITGKNVIPLFSPPSIQAKIKDNFFQTVGNHSEKTVSGNRIFASQMAGKEIHGEIVGFTSRDLSSQIKVSFRPDTKEHDDNCHVQLINFALPLVRQRINESLRNIINSKD